MTAAVSDWETVIEQLEQQSLRLLELARRGDWDTVQAEQPHRQACFESCFARPVPAEAAPTVIAGLRRVAALDERLMELARQHQDDLGRRLSGINRGRQAQAAYRMR
ncbi:MAG: flagellar protein FliT [Candidatus Competibacteraceae bacterium]|nr:flagellar protein FliT [Candidatus Competibacteraceae bacterium]